MTTAYRNSNRRSPTVRDQAYVLELIFDNFYKCKVSGDEDSYFLFQS